MSLANTISKNLIIQFAGKMLGLISGLITVGLLTRHLGADGYGAFTTVLSFLQFFGNIIDFGLSLTILSLTSSIQGEEESAVVSNIITLRVVSGSICFLVAPLAAMFFPYSSDVKLGIAISSLSYLAIAISQVLNGVFQKHLAMHKAAVAEVLGRSVLLAGALAAVALGAGLIPMVIILSLSNIVQCLATFIFAVKYVKIRLRWDPQVVKKIFQTTWPLATSIAFNLIYLRTDVIILSLFKNQTEVGLYGAAYKVLDVVTVLPTMFMGLVLPILAAAWKNNLMSDFKRRLRRASEFVILVSIPLAFGTFAVGRDMMIAIGGQEFAASGKILSILMLAGVAVFVSALYGYTIVAMGLQKKTIPAYGFNALLSIPLYFWLIKNYGGVGAAWTTVIVETFIALVTGVVVYKKLDETINLKLLVKTISASVLMYGLLMALPNFNLFLRIGLGILAYATMAIIFKMITKETLAIIKKVA